MYSRMTLDDTDNLWSCFAYCLKSHGGVRGFYVSLWRFLLRSTLFCHSVATFWTSVSSYEGGCGFEAMDVIRRFNSTVAIVEDVELWYVTDVAVMGIWLSTISLHSKET